MNVASPEYRGADMSGFFGEEYLANLNSPYFLKQSEYAFVFYFQTT